MFALPLPLALVAAVMLSLTAARAEAAVFQATATGAVSGVTSTLAVLLFARTRRWSLRRDSMPRLMTTRFPTGTALPPCRRR